MGYLRGSNYSGPKAVTTWHTRGTRSKKTLEQELAAIKRRVNRNTPAVYDFRQSINYAAPTTAGEYMQYTTNVTSGFTTSGTYHDNVTGDNFLNKSLTLHFSIAADCIRYRVVVYSPLRVGTSFAPLANNLGFVSHPDRSAFRVYRDVTSNPIDATTPRNLHLYVPLRNMKTIRDSDTNLIEQNEIKVLIFFQTSTIASPTNATSIGYKLSICDK